MKKKALASTRNRHTGRNNVYVLSILEHKDSRDFLDSRGKVYVARRMPTSPDNKRTGISVVAG